MGSSVRAKFRLSAVTFNEGGSRTYKFTTDYDSDIPEDQRFQKATPWGEITMNVDNPAVFDHFEIGKSYYADFTVA